MCSLVDWIIDRIIIDSIRLSMGLWDVMRRLLGSTLRSIREFLSFSFLFSFSRFD